LLKIKNQKGFTLIELLIVIVIIGILAGVLIAIIDPAAQQSRARDAGVQASINKASLSAEAFVSAYGDTPEGDEFYASLTNAQDADGDCVAGGYECTFTITGNALRDASCDVDLWRWDLGAANDCQYHYEGDLLGGTEFRICAVSHGIVDGAFCFVSAAGQMMQCEGDGATDCNAIGGP